MGLLHDLKARLASLTRADRRGGVALRLSAVAALSAVIVGAGLGATAKSEPPTVNVTSASGAIEQDNSLKNTHIVKLDDMKPGDSKSGEGTIKHESDLPVLFTLRTTKLEDSPGVPLSARLVLKVQDVTAVPIDVYDGTLAAFVPKLLGPFPAVGERTYRFTVSFPPAVAAVDNLYMGSSTAVDFAWGANPVAGGGSPAPPPQAPPAAPPAPAAPAAPAPAAPAAPAPKPATPKPAAKKPATKACSKKLSAKAKKAAKKAKKSAKKASCAKKKPAKKSSKKKKKTKTK